MSAFLTYCNLAGAPLYGIDNMLTPRRQMVEVEEVSADGLTWTFRLLPGLKCRDGEPVQGGFETRLYMYPGPCVSFVDSMLAEVVDGAMEGECRSPFGSSSITITIAAVPRRSTRPPSR
jgi:hypothetical protein